MGKRLVTEECFPGIRNDVQLTEPIPLEDLSALLYQHYDVIVELLPSLFPPHSAGAFELQPSRGKMGALRERIENPKVQNARVPNPPENHPRPRLLML